MSAAAHTAPGVQPEAIPAELKALRQWVAWRYETRGDKRTKAPINAKSNGRLTYAKSNAPDTWSLFDEALEACGRHTNLAGIGFCFAPDDGLTGIDLDHVLDPDTGELKPEAAEILERFAGTYCEVSPSGTGLRLFAFGKPGRSGKNTGPVKWCEVYSHPSRRYLTVTGRHCPGSATAVTEQQDALDWLHGRFMASTGQEPVASKPGPAGGALDLDDAALLDKARSAKNGAEFTALWSGDTSGHGGDDSAADLALCSLLAFWTGGDAARVDRLFRQSGLMRPKWDSRRGESGTYGSTTVDKAIAGCRDTYSGRTAVRSEAPAGYQAARDARRNAGDGLNPYRGTDDANADLLLGLHGADIRYCPPWDKWLIWSGSHWRIDDRLDIDRLAVDVSRSLRERAITLTRQRQSILEKIAELLAAMNATPGAFESLGPQHGRLVKQQSAIGDEIQWLMKLSGKLEGTAKRGTMLLAARHKVVVHHSDLDKGHFLLNASNGTVDLRTATLRPHERLDLLTHDTAIKYDPRAQCQQWQAFLSSVLGGDTDLIDFVQRAVGYSLTGDVREQILLIVTGVGSNGKSVFLNLLRKLLGKLAIQAAPDLLMVKRSEQHPTDQADLFGKRLVVCQETEEGKRLNESLVKQLTGGDGIRARRMREDFWEFEPTHKIWLSTNHKPEIRGTDHAIWRRIRIIPFNVKFHDPGEGTPVKDTGMEAKLTAELPGILNWAINGCLDWQRQGLKAPEIVQAATEGYRQEMDVLSAWISDCCIVKKHCESKAADLYASYTAWCERSGEYPEKQRKFGMRLKEKYFEQFTNNGAWWRGIGLLANRSTEPTEPTEPGFRYKRAHEKNDFRIGVIGKNGSVPSVPSVTRADPPVEADFIDEGEI